VPKAGARHRRVTLLARRHARLAAEKAPGFHQRTGRDVERAIRLVRPGGAAVEEVMNLVVLPLSALHARGPYELHDLLQGLLVHMVVIGLPISFSVRRFAK
jgi:hypothetical protein